MAYAVSYYRTVRGRCDVEEYINNLPDADDQAKCLALLKRLEKEGPDLRRPQADAVRGDIRELRQGGKQGTHRMLYAKLGGAHYIVLTAFLKQTRKVPEDEIKLAERRLREFQSRSKP